MVDHDQRMILVCTAQVQSIANTQAKKVDTVGGELTFTAGLSPTGQPPATHYWCNWQMTAAEKTALTGYLQALAGKGWAYDATQYTPEQVLALHALAPLEALA